MSEEVTEGISEDAPVEEQPTEEIIEETPVFDPSTQTYKVKIDGEEQEWDWDTLSRNAQTNAALDKKGKQLAEENRRFQQLIAASKTNPDVIIQELTGRDPVEYYESRISKEYEWQQMSPEQQRLAQQQAEIDQYKREQMQRTELAKKQEAQERQMYLREQISEEISTVLNESDLPDDPQLRTRMMHDTAKYVFANRMRAHQMNIEPTVTPAEAARKVMADYQKDIAYFISKHSGDKIAQLLGDEAVKKFNKSLLEQAKKGTLPRPVRDTAGTGVSPLPTGLPKVKQSDDYTSVADWQDANRDRINKNKR